MDRSSIILIVKARYQERAPIRSCYVNIAFGASLPAGELAALCKAFDCGVSLRGFTMGCKQGWQGKAPAGRSGEQNKRPGEP